MHAISRIMLNGWINNIQASWTKLGPEFAQKLLKIGVNDLGGTLMNESISRSAGSNFGQEITAMVTKNNIIGVQFHPEKSHKFGIKFLEAFLENEEF